MSAKARRIEYVRNLEKAVLALTAEKRELQDKVDSLATRIEENGRKIDQMEMIVRSLVIPLPEKKD